MLGSRELRYLAVVVAGYGVDFGVSFSAFKLLGLPLPAAACVGFALAVAFNYLAHEFWTFAGTRRTGYGARFGKFIGVALFTLLVRVGVIFALDPFASSDMAHAALLVGAAGVSLGVNYVLTRFAVFGGRDMEPMA
ncbi:GtrA family protein [Aquabacter cavernae]|uniref:GtrA family protein n=1 Tax=Aquabacter cavernae TaxID=2496029 RepID=UPI000F8E5205|nr:GtrA family protein [Aquabacter cavernae]